MTTSKRITLGVIFLLLVGKVHMAQFSDIELMTAEVGETVILRCYFKDEVNIYFSWYKQTLGGKLKLMSYRMKYYKNATLFYKFENDPRFSVQSGKGINHLKISDLQLSDSATYHCGLSLYLTEFATGVMLHVEGSGTNIQAVVQQSVSESVQPGDSVTLNCTVHTETCDGEHSVYWLRSLEESKLGLIYTHNNQCKESHRTTTTTKSCFYNLAMKNVSPSDAGTYYCAVALCGEILFGKGTMLEIKDLTVVPVLVVYCLGAALSVSFILIIVLAYIIYKLNKKTSLQSRGHSMGLTVSPADAVGHDEDHLHYAALSLSNKKNRPRRQRDNMERNTVYSGVRE